MATGRNNHPITILSMRSTSVAPSGAPPDSTSPKKKGPVKTSYPMIPANSAHTNAISSTGTKLASSRNRTHCSQICKAITFRWWLLHLLPTSIGDVGNRRRQVPNAFLPPFSSLIWETAYKFDLEVNLLQASPRSTLL
ncbi:hypothetical protein OPV22_009271 [Ensete ventricosum]|uniref:Uncharacterized protein n=1 Tax=Ensete ventricosum TaxID=4639 RepID=A0AAV8RGK5_ENSVE|nr:hypothetical protein OPV22_009271 [Ensete ventricosum]